MSADENLVHAQTAIRITKNHISCSNNLRGDRLASFGGGIEELIALWKTDPQMNALISNPAPIGSFAAPVHDDADLVRAAGISPDSVPNLYLMVRNVLASGTAYGNCMEQAALAFVYLYEAGVAPLDYMCFTARKKDKKGRPLYDHAWLVIGLDADAELNDLRTWGDDAVWCDPWQMKDGRAFKISDLVAGRVRNLDWQFRLDTAERIGAGEPASLVRHE